MIGRLLDLDRDGAALFPAVYGLYGLAALARLGGGKPGTRLHDQDLPVLLAPATRIAAGLLGSDARPVRAVMFDKTANANWSLAWHQDRTVVVASRVEMDGFGPWSRKDGALHVAPPMSVLERMLTLRIHLDPCGPDNAPLRIALGSHRLGRVPAAEAVARAEEHEAFDCLAESGDVWVYSTPILHTSGASETPSKRRVLQVDYAAFDLPGGLAWRGVATPAEIG